MATLKKQIFLGNLVLQGFSYRAAKEYDSIRRIADPDRAKKIMGLLPFRSTFDKMFRDILTTRRGLWEEREFFPAFYALVARRDQQRVVCPLEDTGTRSKLHDDDLVALLRRTGALWVRPCYNALKGELHRLRIEKGRVFLNGTDIGYEELRRYFAELPEDMIILRGEEPSLDAVSRYHCECPVLHVVYVRENGLPVLGDRYVIDHTGSDGKWSLYSGKRGGDGLEEDVQVSAAMAVAERISRKYPEAPYLNIGFFLSGNGPKIWQVDVGKDLIWLQNDSDAVHRFLEEKRRQGKTEARGLPRIERYLFSVWAKKQGFQDYMYRNWLRGLKEDNRLPSTTREEKRWAHSHGFYSYRIKQYGLTEENYRTVLSDYDYKRLRPINGYYQKWLWDKIFMYHIMAPYQSFLPRHYYRVVPTECGNQIFSFDLGAPLPAKMDDVIALLREKKILVAKPSVGSHGNGFSKVEWQEDTGTIAINGQAYTEEEFRTYVMTLDKSYFLSEYVQMHSDLRRIYNDVVDTVRIMVIDIGDRPKVESAFFRIGSSHTGNTDNLDTGGIVARVDVETGRFGNTEMLMNHVYQPCSVHPDSGAPLEGVLPHWGEIKASVSDIAAYLYPMEYLGFDIVITQDGFRILEINTHQDLHRYPEYPQEVKDYFARKLALKGDKDNG